MYDDDPDGVKLDDPGEELALENENAGAQGLHTQMPHRGLWTGGFQRLVDGLAYGMVLLYIGQSAPMFPLTDHTPTKEQRNAEVRMRYSKGQSVGYLARLFRLSEQRVSQIIHFRRR